MSLLRIIYSSIKNTSNIYRSIVGYRVINNITTNMDSEFNRNHWSITKGIYLLSDIFIPSLPFHCPDWMPNIIKKTIFGGNSKFIEDTENDDNDRIYMIFVNGILTNETLLEQNKHLLKKIFNRPINCIHNNTDSLIMDLIECGIGKVSDDLTESAFLTLSIIIKKVLDNKIDKLVIICHSQGSIIVSQALRNLEKFGLNRNEYLKKLEIFTFANCSSDMRYIKDEYPYMEHIANEHDLVAKMGSNRDNDIAKYIHIDGEIIIKKNKYGHFFNCHYMNNFIIDYPKSRLNNYIKNEN